MHQNGITAYRRVAMATAMATHEERPPGHGDVPLPHTQHTHMIQGISPDQFSSLPNLKVTSSSPF